MKLSTLTPSQEFVLKALRFDRDLYVGVKNQTPKMFQGDSVLFNLGKPSFENLVALGYLVEIGDKWLLNKY